MRTAILNFYPSKNKVAICLPMIIIFKARQATLNDVKNHKSKKIIGIDSQYVNNKYRLPLTVMTTSNSNHNAIQAFVMLSSHSDTHAYSKFIRVVRKYSRIIITYLMGCA